MDIRNNCNPHRSSLLMATHRPDPYRAFRGGVDRAPGLLTVERLEDTLGGSHLDVPPDLCYSRPEVRREDTVGMIEKRRRKRCGGPLAQAVLHRKDVGAIASEASGVECRANRSCGRSDSWQ